MKTRDDLLKYLDDFYLKKQFIKETERQAKISKFKMYTKIYAADILIQCFRDWERHYSTPKFTIFDDISRYCNMMDTKIKEVGIKPNEYRMSTREEEELIEWCKYNGLPYTCDTQEKRQKHIDYMKSKNLIQGTSMSLTMELTPKLEKMFEDISGFFYKDTGNALSGFYCNKCKGRAHDVDKIYKCSNCDPQGKFKKDELPF